MGEKMNLDILRPGPCIAGRETKSDDAEAEISWKGYRTYRY
jgi:hypothetical protein